MNLIGRIFEEMSSDDDDMDKQSEILLEIWSGATVDQKKLIDEVMLSLCGWTMGTLINMTGESTDT
jgi:hypothetical protein